MFLSSWNKEEPSTGEKGETPMETTISVGAKYSWVIGKQQQLEVAKQTNKQTPWSESARELYPPSDRRLSAKWLPTFVDKGCHVVSVTDPYGRILGL
jgi:hypothetical protein